MEIKRIKTILFYGPNGEQLRLSLGKINDMVAYNQYIGSASNDDKGFRWQFVGPKIPMPIRSYEWFNGFPEDTMLSWLKSQGYTVAAVTNHISGSMYVAKGKGTYGNEVNKGNDWVPTSSGRLPNVDHNIQVTYLSDAYAKPACEMAYFNVNSGWHWPDGEPVGVKITAWRYCEPYQAP